jgi:hypothetical protein
MSAVNETDPRKHPRRSRIEAWSAVEPFVARAAFSILSLIWIAGGILAFIVITWIAISWWRQGTITETTDLPPIFKWLFGFWAAVQGAGAVALWKPFSYYFR